MSIQSREEFGEYCLRALGKPVININVHADQLEDRIDEALGKYAEYHFDGTEHVYMKHQVTAQDKINKYIEIPDNIVGAVKIFPLQGTATTGGDIFDVRYQIAMNDLYNLTTVSIVPYVMTMTRLNEMNELLVGQIPVRFNRLAGKLWLDMDWNKVPLGHYIIIEAYQLVDPEEFADVWNDSWLKHYATAVIKKQWGANLSKFANMQLPGGISLNGREIQQEAKSEISELEEQLKTNYTMPLLDRMA
jgi:hypothetical protein